MVLVGVHALVEKVAVKCVAQGENLMPSLKEQNKKSLVLLLLISLLPLYVSMLYLHGSELKLLFKKDVFEFYRLLAFLGLPPLLVLSVVLILIVDSVSNTWKERMAHFRWSDPLPACRVDKLINSDSRIDTVNAPQEVKELLDTSLSPSDKNKLWYKNIYLKVRDLSAVANTHKDYLLYREAVTGSVILFVLIGVIDLTSRFIYGSPLMFIESYIAQFIIVGIYMKTTSNKGNRLAVGAVANFLNLNNNKI